ncbi:hypothetical protein FTX61_10875 [Nitriliruptoraceae bacterium ZYF776]|nr:hypothetical protein [Profundirhabdus halotolerans]
MACTGTYEGPTRAHPGVRRRLGDGEMGPSSTRGADGPASVPGPAAGSEPTGTPAPVGRPSPVRPPRRRPRTWDPSQEPAPPDDATPAAEGRGRVEAVARGVSGASAADGSRGWGRCRAGSAAPCRAA